MKVRIMHVLLLIVMLALALAPLADILRG